MLRTYGTLLGGKNLFSTNILCLTAHFKFRAFALKKKKNIMDFKELSKWFWDIAKYVVTAVIISTFLGNFQENAVLLYVMSFVVVALLVSLGVFFQKLSKKDK